MGKWLVYDGDVVDWLGEVVMFKEEEMGGE